MTQKELRQKIKSAIKSKEEVSRDEMLRWIKIGEQNLLTLSFLHELTNVGYWQIKPELGKEITCKLIRRFYLECIKKNPRQVEYVCSRYEAAWSLVTWFQFLHKRGEEAQNELLETKDALKNLYLTSGRAIREAITNGFLEHVFETPVLRTYFDDWKNEKEIAEDYQWAMKWGLDHEGNDFFAW